MSATAAWIIKLPDETLTELQKREAELASYITRDAKQLEEATKTLYFTRGAGRIGGPMWGPDTPREVIAAYSKREMELSRRFEAMWKKDPQRARTIDWQSIELSPA